MNLWPTVSLNVVIRGNRRPYSESRMSVSQPEPQNSGPADSDPPGGDAPRTPPGKTTLVAAFAGMAVVAGVVAAGVAMPAVGSVAAVTNTAIDSFEAFPTKLADPVLPQRSTLTDAKGRRIAYLFEQNRVNVPIKDISKSMQEAIVSIEDSRFYEHNGVDVRGTARAFFTNQGSGSIQQGGSTITQQYVKMILLNNAKTKVQQEAATERSPERKLREARFAIAMEKNKTKEQILNGYLNIAYFGSGAYGVETAAQTYFSKPAKRLNLLESATLAGAVQQPGAFDPIRNPKASQVRRNLVLNRMKELGYISAAQYQQASKVPTKSYVNPTLIKNGCPTSRAPYFCDYVLNYIRNEPAFGPSRRDRIDMLETGGLIIKTTLEPNAQNASQNSVENNIPVGDSSNKAAAISMVQPGTGRVLAMAQNTRWGTKGAGRTAYNYNVRKNEGGTIGMQSGSTFKAFTLAAALEKGISPYTTINVNGIDTFYGFQDCQGYTFPPYTVKSGESGSYNMFSGTAMSVNGFFVGLEKMVSLCRQAELAESLGVRKGDGEPLNKVPSFVLGANEVVPLDMAGAYAAFDNDGVWCKPNPVESMTTLAGKRVYKLEPQCRRVLSSSVADGVTDLLSGPVSGGGTAPNANFGRPIRGKTGTTDSSSAVWFVGYTPQISAAVWVGDPRGGYRYPLNNVVINGSYYGTVFGATIPAPIWRQAMEGAHQNLPYKDFGGGPRGGFTSIDLGQGNAQRPDDQGDAAQQEPTQQPTQEPAPAPEPPANDFGQETLDNLPEFNFR